MGPSVQEQALPKDAKPEEEAGGQAMATCSMMESLPKRRGAGWESSALDRPSTEPRSDA